MRQTAVVVGGTSGIGLSLAKNLIQKGYFVKILGRDTSNLNVLPEGNFLFNYCDLMDFREDLFYEIADDKTINLFFLSAGIGRLANFNSIHIKEIEKTLTINTISILKAIKCLYKRIYNDELFYSGVISSIAGRLSSPLASVYSASKSAIAKFLEAINIELEMNGFRNRILDVSPGYIEGTRFYGGENNIEKIENLSINIINKILERKSLYIPNYEDTYKEILFKYNKNPHDFAVESYKYKMNSKRLIHDSCVKIGYLSGTFDLFHIGHLNLLRKAKGQCDYLIVGVHDSGKWKGKETFIPLEERKAIVAACKYVDKVVDSCREDSDAWSIYHYDKLFVGSDYKGTERFQRYHQFFADKNVEIIYFPYTKHTSSTQLRKVIVDKIEN